MTLTLHPDRQTKARITTRATLNANANGRKPERRMIGNRSMLAVPVTMVREMVLNGVLVTANEFAKWPGMWDGTPLVMGHPQDKDGNFISANRPDQIVMGRTFDTELDFETLMLNGEAYFDVELMQALGGEFAETLEALESGKQIETSTAYFADATGLDGNRDGVEFFAVASNIVPDHLAVLTDQPGACSGADGCGFNRNQSDPITANCGDQQCVCGANAGTIIEIEADEVDDPEIQPAGDPAQPNEVFTMSKQTKDPAKTPDAGQQPTANADTVPAGAPEGNDAPEITNADVMAQLATLTEAVSKLANVPDQISAVNKRIDDVAAVQANAAEQARNATINELIANEACPFTEAADFEGMPDAALAKMRAKYATAPAANQAPAAFYGAQAGFGPGAGINQAELVVLEVPTIDFTDAD